MTHAMAFRKADAALIATAAFASLPLWLPLSGPLRVAAAFLLVFYLPGYFFLLAAGNAKRPRLDDVVIPLILSPILVSTALIIVDRAGLPFDRSVTAVAIATVVLCLAAAAARRAPGERMPSVTRRIFVVMGGFALLVTGSYLVNRFLIIRSDAWFHGCVVSDILARGLPPMEPGFPDVPIRYMWSYHAFNAAWKDLSGLSVFPALAVFNVVNAFAFPYLMARLTALFFPERRYVLMVAALSVAGLESVTWILWPLNLTRAFTGEVHGIAEVARILGAVQLGNAGVLDFLRLHWTWMVSLPDKFLTITAFSYALNLFVFAFIQARNAEFQGRSRVRNFLDTFVPIFGALLFHVIVGMSLAFSALGAVGLSLLGRLARRGALLPRAQEVSLGVAAALALAASVPYLASLVSGGSGGAGLRGYVHVGFQNAVTIAVPFVVLLPASWRALRRILSPANLDGRMALAWMMPLLAMNLVVNLPTVNESKLVFPLFLLALPFIGHEIAAWFERLRGARRAALSCWIAILFAVPFALTFRGFLLDGPREYCEEKRYRPTAAERELYRWIAAETPARASIIGRSMCNLMPVYANRRSFVPNRETINIDGYAGPKVDLYMGIHADLFSGKPDLDADLAALAGTPNTYYLVLWAEDREADRLLESRLAGRPGDFAVVFRNDAGTVYAVRAAPREGAQTP